MDELSRPSWAKCLAAYLCLATILCFVGLGTGPAFRNEGIVTDAARHMARTGDLVVPHLYNEPYTYKPPLAYWLALASFELTGVENTWTLRLPTVLCAFLMGFVVLVMVGKMCGRGTGFISAIASLTSGLMLDKIRIAEYDVPLAAGVGIAVVAACLNLAQEREWPFVWFMGYIALAAGFLAKGLPALMTYFPGLIAAAFFSRQMRRLFSSAHLVAAVLFAMLVSSYLWLLYSAGGPAVFDQPLLEARNRGIVWDWHSLGLTLLKPGIIWGSFLPWSVALVFLLVGRGNWGLDNATRRVLVCSLAFAGAGTLALIAVPTMETRYFLPLAVPLSIASGIAATSPLRLSARVLCIRRRVCLSLAFCSATLAMLGAVFAWSTLSPARGGVILTAAGLLSIGFLTCSRARRSPALALLFSALCAWATVVFAIEPRRLQESSLLEVTNTFRPHLEDDSWLWILSPTGAAKQSALVFYLDRPVTPLYTHGPLPLHGSIGLLSPNDTAKVESETTLRCHELAQGRHLDQSYRLCRLEEVIPAACETAATRFDRARFDDRVTRLYLAILGRLPDPREAETYANRLRRATPLAELARALLNTPEYRQGAAAKTREDLAQRLYRGIFNRGLTPAGLGDTLKAIRAGRLATRAAHMLTTREYRRRYLECASNSQSMGKQ